MSSNGGLRVGIFVFDGAEELDVVGPFEVLSVWADHSELRPTVSTFSWNGNGVRLSRGLRIVPSHSADDIGAVHLLVYPGGIGTRELIDQPHHLDWLRAMREQTAVVAGVSTGALPLAAAGILAGRVATTHEDSFDELVKLDPSIMVDTEARFVDEGDVITSAGVTAGIDMALHLVSRLETPAVARAVQRVIQYRGATEPWFGGTPGPGGTIGHPTRGI
ncbi:DJ-1/PfpI family protein [Myceligenerans indicum]|uniref:DJ-1/PfpI family protein n=1 Tax=Myceligenerans indicum TaxID=2593663 RepID=A0ABS1LKG7_9MICO|nr:DJ-1/PfpI family protein [Myceligenerans indicum]MBL0886603.1 DJ-1/PfpI family protein [Myceligenerans indicum]